VRKTHGLLPTEVGGVEVQVIRNVVVVELEVNKIHGDQ